MPDSEQLFPEDQWYNMSPVPQGGQEVSDGQEDREEEAREVREMKEAMQQRTEECGARQERSREYGGQDGGVRWQGDLGFW